MRKLLIVVDMQTDFITGALGTPQAQGILPNVQAKIRTYRQEGHEVLFTRDTHQGDYLQSQEGRILPVLHCIEGTAGHRIAGELSTEGCQVMDKPTFGSLALAQRVAEGGYDAVEICGLCTDICVVSNALILKAKVPELPITVDARCCAGVTEESHHAALLTMQMCQVLVTGED